MNLSNFQAPKWLIVAVPAIAVIITFYFLASSCQENTATKGPDRSEDIQLSVPNNPNDKTDTKKKSTKSKAEYYTTTEREKWEKVSKQFAASIVPQSKTSKEEWIKNLSPIISTGLKAKLNTVDERNIPTGKRQGNPIVQAYGENYVLSRQFFSGNLIINYRVIRDKSGNWIVDQYLPERR